MTEQELAEIEARADAASPGPWTRDLERHTSKDWPVTGVEVLRAADGDLIAEVSYPDLPSHQANVAFVLAAREDVPALVEEVRWLWALRDVPCGRCGQLLGEHVPGVHLPGPAAGVECPTSAARGEAARERRYSTESTTPD